MKFTHDFELLAILAGVFALIAAVTIVALVMDARVRDPERRPFVENLKARCFSFGAFALVGGGALVSGELPTIALFLLISLLALREFMTLAPTRSSDHRVMVWTFFVIAPLQYAVVTIHWYGFYSIMIPVYAFVLIPTLNAMTGDTGRFLERTSTIQWGLFLCVYCLSHAPALCALKIPGFGGETAKLLLYCILIAQLSDFLQYAFGKWLGRTTISATVSPQKTWEGLLGGGLGATAVGTALWWATPFPPVVAAVFSLVVVITGFAGGFTLSAIKRDRGVKDFGDLLPGQGGILDRVDSICFSIPVFFHLTRYFYARGS